jgi:hypothetical protein
MAGKQAPKSRARRSGKSTKGQTAKGEASPERTAQTWRQPPPTPRTKMVRKQTGTTRVTAGPGVSPIRGWLRRVKEVRGFAWLQAGIFVALIAAAAGAAYGTTLEPFRVSSDSIEVRGPQRLEAREVVEAAELDGQNVFMVQAEPVADRILALQGVKSVGVRVHLPNRVIIEISEFLPLVEWQRPDGRRWLAEDGSLVPITGDAPALILVDPQAEAADADGNLESDTLENLKVIHEMLPEQRELYYGKVEGIYFRAPQGWNVYLGEEGRMARKLSVLAGLEDMLIARDPRPKKVDLRFEEFPTFE